MRRACNMSIVFAISRMYYAGKMELCISAKVIPLVLKTLRARRGLTQDDLAHRAKLDKQTVCRLETNKDKEKLPRAGTL